MEQPREKLYTYEDYEKLEGRWELIDGALYAMTSPSVKHQKLSRKLANDLEDAFNCEVIQAIDVVFPESVKHRDKIIDCVEPDISVVCDRDKIGEAYIQGAPDLIVEILSPSTNTVDTILKRELYEKNGVPIYWMIDPRGELYELGLEDRKYSVKQYNNGDILIIKGKEFLFEVD